MQEDRLSRLLGRARDLPDTPGVYQMYSQSGQLLYVGKSKALKNRVSSYFAPGEKTPKTARLVAQIEDFTTISTATEMEALLLENELIKLHKPKYNILLKDDKSYPYLHLSTHEAYPRLSMVRSRDADGKGLYFGPYSSASAVFALVRAANEIFRLPRCRKKFPAEFGKGRPCLYYDMGQCIGLCRGNLGQEEYRRIIDELLLFLRHDHKKLADELTARMLAASSKLNFEEAARLRDCVNALNRLGQRQSVLAKEDYSADVYALYPDETLPTVSRLTIRRGRLIDATSYSFSAAQILDAESFYSLLWDHYRIADDLPARILLSEELFFEGDTLLSALLAERCGHKVPLCLPRRGKGADLRRLAYENAKKECTLRLKAREKDEGVLTELQTLLKLPAPPVRIEAYDISNSAAEIIYGGMIVCRKGRFARSQYRSFSIHQEVKDDYAAMREVLTRRMAHLSEEGWEKPDLILLDGGATHVSTVKRALFEMGIRDVPVFGMVKDAFHKTRTLTDEEHELSIAAMNTVFGFIYRIQEEVHRYSLSCMDAARRRRLKKSSLCDIHGIGEQKARELMRHFKSLTRIRAATEDELCHVPHISRRDAQSILAHFQNEK